MVKAVTMYKDARGHAHKTAHEATAADHKSRICSLLKASFGFGAKSEDWMLKAAYNFSRHPRLANDIIAALERHEKTLPPKETE